MPIGLRNISAFTAGGRGRGKKNKNGPKKLGVHRNVTCKPRFLHPPHLVVCRSPSPAQILPQGCEVGALQGARGSVGQGWQRFNESSSLKKKCLWKIFLNL